MSATQVTAALGLLKKALPDLSAMELDARHDVSDPLAEMLKTIASRGTSLAVNDSDTE